MEWLSQLFGGLSVEKQLQKAQNSKNTDTYAAVIAKCTEKLSDQGAQDRENMLAVLETHRTTLGEWKSSEAAILELIDKHEYASAETLLWEKAEQKCKSKLLQQCATQISSYNDIIKAYQVRLDKLLVSKPAYRGGPNVPVDVDDFSAEIETVHEELVQKACVDGIFIHPPAVLAEYQKKSAAFLKNQEDFCQLVQLCEIHKAETMLSNRATLGTSERLRDAEQQLETVKREKLQFQTKLQNAFASDDLDTVILSYEEVLAAVQAKPYRDALLQPFKVRYSFLKGRMNKMKANQDTFCRLVSQQEYTEAEQFFNTCQEKGQDELGTSDRVRASEQELKAYNESKAHFEQPLIQAFTGDDLDDVRSAFAAIEQEFQTKKYKTTLLEPYRAKLNEWVALQDHFCDLVAAQKFSEAEAIPQKDLGTSRRVKKYEEKIEAYKRGNN